MDIFAINLKKRPERRLHIVNEFSYRREFNLQVVDAIEHEVGSFGLWQTIQLILSTRRSSEYTIICEDDHLFTKDYSIELLNETIGFALKKDVDILLGGISWFDIGLQVKDNLFWVNNFTGLQFSIIFNSLYEKILNTKFSVGENADFVISRLTEKKNVIYPFVSIQKEFGYSDVTSFNNENGRVTNIFNNAFSRFEILLTVNKYYNIKF